ncbi:hypothetical protein ACE939_03660 [Aquimarina sp. W85]|uniref:hypothetical protein n=1 Tax=Aquimarina rhodophyticola TaxID=3342246 RepID=UPI00366DE76C
MIYDYSYLDSIITESDKAALRYFEASESITNGIIKKFLKSQSDKRNGFSNQLKGTLEHLGYEHAYFQDTLKPLKFLIDLKYLFFKKDATYFLNQCIKQDKKIIELAERMVEKSVLPSDLIKLIAVTKSQLIDAIGQAVMLRNTLNSNLENPNILFESKYSYIKPIKASSS